MGDLSGTSIHELNNTMNENNAMNYYDMMQQINNSPTNNTPTSNIPTNNTPTNNTQYISQMNPMNVSDLAKNLNDNLNDDFLDSLTDDDGDDDDNSDKNDSIGNKLVSFIPKFLREPLLVLILFLILSHPGVRTFLGTYIPQINPNTDGIVSFSGVFIYGILLASLFLLFKQFLL